MSTRFDKVPRDLAGFLAWENRQKGRYELVDGVVRLMSGGKLVHDLLSANAIYLLRASLGRSAFRVHGSNLKVVSPVGMVTYPDAFVRCGPADEDVTEIADPIVIVEVLSERTRGHDLVAKRWAYQAIPTLQALVYVEPSVVGVELTTRLGPDRWQTRFFRSLDDTVTIQAIDAVVHLRDLYAGTRAGGGG